MSSSAPVPVDRLRASQDIRSVFETSQRRAGRYVVVHARDRAGDGIPRVAVVASRRVGSAVARNRAKRLLREAARHCSWRAGLDLVLVARGPASTAHLAEVQRDVCEVAERLGLLDQASTT